MRVEFAGYSGPLPPFVLNLVNGVPFLKAQYLAMGYTNYDVICIGSAGGRGIGIDAIYNSKGGAGGGGGVQWVEGLLSSLPVSSPVDVGVAGADAISPNGKYGGDGDRSRFNTNTCRASGGKGGFPGYGVFPSPFPHGDGGAGGMGGISDVSGSGAVFVGPLPAGIGTGGKGGKGGVFYNNAITTPATAGLPGTYSETNASIPGPGEEVSLNEFGHLIVPGAGGGAKATPLNLKSTVYGSKIGGALGHGAVILRLTQV